MTKGISPTQRTLRELRGQGRIAAIAEKWNAFAGPPRPDGTGRVGVRQDLFGFIDLIALDRQNGIVAVQCCAGSGHAEHKRKILEEAAEAALEWLTCGGKIELWSWSKRKLVRGGKAERWTPRIEVITRESFEANKPF